MGNKALDPEGHFNSKIKSCTVRDQGTVISFVSQPFIPKKFTTEKGIKRIVKEDYKYSDFIEINKMHREYLRELRGTLHPYASLNLIYKAELTGAEIEIAGRTGFVIQERKNSLTVIFPGDLIKVYPKSLWNFRMKADGIDYLFFGKDLKKNRFLKN